MTESKRTPLHALHRAAGARFLHFDGWEMPLEYSGISREHHAVRTGVGLFDVSHMGEILVRGNAAEAFLQTVTANDVARLPYGKAQYTVMLQPNGTVIDDLLLYRLALDRYLMIVNAGTADTDFQWLQEANTFGVELEDVSNKTALLAIQGPSAERVLEGLTRFDLSGLTPFSFVEGPVAGVAGILSRTGYTGEDGFEFCFPNAESAFVWKALLDAGRAFAIVPAGLGARNTLRMEAGLLLYGRDMDRSTTPLEAGIESQVKFDKGEFIGRQALLEQKQTGIGKKLAGFRTIGRQIAREGHPVLVAGRVVGHVTSGGPSITLKCNIGLAYLPIEYAHAGRGIQIQIRNHLCDAEVVPMPFYKRRAAV